MTHPRINVKIKKSPADATKKASNRSRTVAIRKELDRLTKELKEKEAELKKLGPLPPKKGRPKTIRHPSQFRDPKQRIKKGDPLP